MRYYFTKSSWVKPVFFRVSTIGTTKVFLSTLPCFICRTEEIRSSQNWFISSSTENLLSFFWDIKYFLQAFRLKKPQLCVRETFSTKAGRESSKPVFSTLISACRRSYALCISRNKRALIPKVFCTRKAKSAEIPIFPEMILETVEGEIFNAFAKEAGVILKAVRTSSMISPGWHGFSFVINSRPCNQKLADNFPFPNPKSTVRIEQAANLI